MQASDGVLPVCVEGSGVQPHYGTAGCRGTGGDGVHRRDIGRFSEKEQGGGASGKNHADALIFPRLFVSERKQIAIDGR